MLGVLDMEEPPVLEAPLLSGTADHSTSIGNFTLDARLSTSTFGYVTDFPESLSTEPSFEETQLATHPGSLL